MSQLPELLCLLRGLSEHGASTSLRTEDVKAPVAVVPEQHASRGLLIDPLLLKPARKRSSTGGSIRSSRSTPQQLSGEHL